MHKHHIMPRNLGGSNNSDNLVEVTVEEHSKIHHSQWILSGRWQDYVAWQALSGMINKEDIIRLVMSLSKKGKPSNNKGGYKLSENTKKKMRNHPDKKENARKAALVAVSKRGPNYNKEQSQRIKLWWDKRKGLI